MKNRRNSLLVGEFVLVLMAGCTYEMPTAQVVVDGQGGSGGSGGATSSSSSVAMGTPEDCLDGKDNDEDGAVDCADSDCGSGFACMDVPPKGWSLVVVERGNGEPPANLGCANDDNPEIVYTGPVGPAECEACTCGPLEGTTCRPRNLSCFAESPSCGGTAKNLTNLVSMAECTKPDLGGAVTISCRVPGNPIVDEAGGCAPSITDFSNKYPWTGWLKACPANAAGGSGCAGGVCLPKQPAGTSVCIRKDGSHDCPAGWMGTEAFANVKDDRACAECTCTPKPQCVGGGYEFFDHNDCTLGGAGSVLILNSTCVDAMTFPDSDSWSFRQILPTSGGSCMAGGGEPVGAVVPDDPVTFCCK